MIDKIKGRISDIPYLISPKGKYLEVTVNHHASETVSEKYQIEGIKFSINNKKTLTMNQSIGKALNGYKRNYYYQDYINDLREIKSNPEIQIDYMELEIDSVELFWDIETTYEPINYTTLIGPKTVHEFSQITGHSYVYGDTKSSKSIYEATDNYKICIYDKSIESNSGEKILRYELKIVKPMDYFKLRNKLKLKELLEPDFFKELTYKMFDTLTNLNIRRTQKFTNKIDEVSGLTKSDIIDYYTYLGVQSCGGHSKEINRLKGMRGLDSSNRCRTIKHLFGVYSNPIVFESSSLHEEMIEKFRFERDRNITSLETFNNNGGFQQYLQSIDSKLNNNETNKGD